MHPQNKFLDIEHLRLHAAARIVGLAGPPVLDEFFQFRIGRVGPNDLEFDVFIPPRSIRASDTFAAQAQDCACIGALGHVHRDRPGRGGNRNLAAQNRFGKGDRQYQMDVVALAGKERMRCDNNFDESVAGGAAADPWAAFAGEPKQLAVARTRRDSDIDG